MKKLLPLLPALIASTLLISCSPSAPSGDATRRWLDTFDRFVSQKEFPERSDLQPATSTASALITFEDVLQQLPAPETWPTLAATLRTKRDAFSEKEVLKKLRYQLGLLALLHLQNHPEATRPEFERFKKELTELKFLTISDETLNSLGVALSASTPESSWELHEFEKQLQQNDQVTDEQIDEALHEKGAAARLRAQMAKWRAFSEDLRRRYLGMETGSLTDAQKEKLKKESTDFQKANHADLEWSYKAMANSTVERYIMQRQMGTNHFRQSLRVPNLIKLAGPEKAAAYLKEAFSKPFDLEFESAGPETIELARTIALQNLKTLNGAPWELAAERGQAAFFEALLKQFGAPKRDHYRSNYSFSRACGYQVVELAQTGRTAEAIARYRDLIASDAFPYLNFDATELIQNGQAENVLAFVTQASLINPKLNEWSLFDKMGKLEEKQKLLQTLLARPNLPAGAAIDLRSELQETLIARIQIDAAAALFKELTTRQLASPEEAKNRVRYAMKWHDLAELLQKPVWRDAALSEVHRDLDYLWSNARREYFSAQSEYLSTLFNRHQYEAIIHEFQQSANQLRSQKTDPKQPSVSTLAPALPYYFAALVETGHQQEALDLLRDNPNWDWTNLSQALDHTLGKPSRPMGYYVARALLATGQRDMARRVLEAQMISTPANDGAYEVYVKEFGLQSIPLLDRLYAIDQFEERPLLWKAVALADAGKWTEAEKVIRTALTVDPTDGEEEAGDRIRGYGVMARIMDGLHNAPQAKFYHSVVDAVQLAEQADRYREAGLSSRAMDLYQQSLAIFQDGYCIQFRLAKELANKGDLEGATAHYRKAYELMPGSFGRVESFCFGCEKAFGSPLQQTLAEQIFTETIRKNPASPQAHYMMGYLRLEQKRKPEAIAEFRKAVELDPQYLNAWKELLDANDSTKDPAAYENIALTLARLDPAQRHTSLQVEHIRDYAKLWHTIHDMEQKTAGLNVPKDLYDLPATRARYNQRENRYNYSTSNRPPSLGRLLREIDAIEKIGDFFQMLTNPNLEDGPKE